MNVTFEGNTSTEKDERLIRRINKIVALKVGMYGFLKLTLTRHLFKQFSGVTKPKESTDKKSNLMQMKLIHAIKPENA